MGYKRNRLLYLILIVIVIVLGLGSRSYSHIFPNKLNIYLGDALWAIMIFFIVGFILKKKPIKTVGTIAWVFCIIIEISQLYQREWINAIRNTRIGGLVLGYGFLWSDIVAYTIGIVIAVILEMIVLNYKKIPTIVFKEDFMKFRDKIVIVTGSGKGIGKSIAQLYGEAGAKVIIAEKNENNGKEVEGNIIKNGGESIFIKTDVSIPNDIINLVSEVDRMFGRIDILINNAGISKWNSPYSLEIEEWEYIINTNLRSVFLCTREVAKVMRKSGGAIVNISSTRAIMSEPNSEAYAASKGGIVSLTHAFAASLSKDKIRVNCISPGWIEIEDYNKLTEIDHLLHLSGRVGIPEDVASACLFLTSGENSFINGTNIVIDGGMTKKMIYEQ